jgi:glycosyltransferase involved in cell wall biosynthesis
MAFSLTEAVRNSSFGVSVIIPAYNYARFLSEAIDSALSQNYSPIEIIVVDDGSRDETPTLLARYSDPRLRVIHKKNEGLSAARNTGIKEANYPFVAFLDADDRWANGFLSATMEQFMELPENYGIVATASQRMSEYGQLVHQPRSIVSPPTTLSANHFILLNRVFPSAVTVRKSAFSICGYFDETLKSSEDRDMWIRITAKFPARYLNKILVHIRRHGENMSRNSSRMRENTSTTLYKAWKSKVISQLNIPFWCAAKSYFEYQSAWTHFSDGSRSSALKYITLSFLFCPFFLHPSHVGESSFFRLRAIRHFIFRPAKKPQIKVITSPE